MCWTCVLSEMHDAEVTRVDVNDEMRRVGGLIAELYETEWGGVGGPLHVVVDDNNVADSNLTFCRDAIAEFDRWAATFGDDDRRLCHAVLDGLEPMTEVERSVTVQVRGADWAAVRCDENSIWPTNDPDAPPPAVTTVVRTSSSFVEVVDVDPDPPPLERAPAPFVNTEVFGRYPSGTDPRLAIREVMTEFMRRTDGSNDLPWWLRAGVTWWHGGGDGIRVGEDIVPPSLSGRVPHVEGTDPNSVYVTRNRDDALLYATWHRSPMLYEVTFPAEPQPDDTMDNPDSFRVPKATVRKIHGLTRTELEATLHKIFGGLEP